VGRRSPSPPASEWRWHSASSFQIPLATLAAGAPPLGERGVGIATGIAAGVLAYLGTAHLLPETGAQRAAECTMLAFTLTLVATSSLVLVVLRDKPPYPGTSEASASCYTPDTLRT
jgi:hypothetical protein